MSRFGFTAIPVFLAAVFFSASQTHAQLSYAMATTDRVALMRFNNEGEINGEGATWRLLLAKRDGTATWPVTNDFLTNGYNLSQNPMFFGLKDIQNFTPVWVGLANIDSQEKNDVLLKLVQSAQGTAQWNYLFGAAAASSTEGAPPDGTANYWVRTRDGVKIYDGRTNNAANLVPNPNRPGTNYYVNWSGSEPNNSGGGEWAGIFYGNAQGGWNDNTGANQPGGYFAEFDLGNTNTFEIDPSQNTMILNPATGTYYLRGQTQMNWESAKVYAEMRSWNGIQGQLATVPDKTANWALTTAPGNALWGGWIGLTNEAAHGGTYYADAEQRRTEGWVWSGPNGSTPFDASAWVAWDTNEPSGGAERYVELKNNGRWNDCGIGTADKYPFVEFVGQTPIDRNFYVEAIYQETNVANYRRFIEGDAQYSGYYAALNFADPEARGDSAASIAGRIPFPGDTDADDNNFLIRAQSQVYIPEPGTYVFGSRHDDNLRIYLDRGDQMGFRFTNEGSTTNTMEVAFDKAGYYNLTVFFREATGGACLNLIGMKKPDGMTDQYTNNEAGFVGMYNDGARLVGDTVNGGLATAMYNDPILATDNQGFTVRQVKKLTNGGLANWAEIDTILATGNSMIPGDGFVTGIERINFSSPGSGTGQYQGDVPFPGGGGDYFVLQAEATLVVPETGWYTFGSITDDSFMLIIRDFFDEQHKIVNFAGDIKTQGTNVQDGILYADNMNGTNTGVGNIYLEAGLYSLDYRFWENTGGEHAELIWAAGRWNQFDSEMFRLLEIGTLDVSTIPEPSTWVMMILGAGGVFLVARRKKNRK